jgi:tetratricopeptide (TPR) repeat protein
MPSRPLSSFLRSLAAAGALATASLWAQAPAEPVRDYSMADSTIEELQKFKTAQDNKDIKGAMAIIDSLLAKVPADSFDAAYLLVQKSQLYMQLTEYSKAVDPLARAVQLSDSKNPTYFDDRQSRDLYFFLFQLHFQEANSAKDPTVVATHYDKAQKAIERWLVVTPQSSADAQMFYAQLLISRALLIPDKPDKPLLEKALKEIEKGMLLATRPKDTFYLLKLICLQQLDRTAESTELMELVVKQKPDSSNYWQQLAALYLSMGSELRAVVTIERAQAMGFMNTPRDNFNLIGIYFNIGQYEKAAELLEKHLRSGSIENDPKNWELLALSYQQMQRPLKAIEALKEGTKSFPKSGQMEFQIAQAYTSLDKTQEAMTHVQAALTKGNLAKPHQAYLLLAFSAYQLKKFEVALEAATKAAEFPEAAKDATNMKNALESLMKEREAKKNKT